MVRARRGITAGGLLPADGKWKVGFAARPPGKRILTARFRKLREPPFFASECSHERCFANGPNIG